METKTYHWKANRPIVEHYLHDYKRVQALFEYDPWEDGAVKKRLAWLDKSEHIKVDRERLVDVLLSYNQRIHNKEEALEAVAALADKKTLVVVGGQQAGLLTGPLLVIYKAITLIQTAERESVRLQRKVVPVFWIAGEDHDFDEVNHTYFLTQQLEVEKVRLGNQMESDRSPISHLTIDRTEWQHVLEQLEPLLIETEFKTGLIEKLQQVSEQSKTLSDFFAQVLAWLFGHHGLIILDSAESSLRDIEAPMFEALIENSDAINTALLRSKAKLNALGYEAQADVREQQANLFAIHEGQRLLLYENDDGYSDRRAEVHFTKSALLEMARTSPDKLSNNVFTRPLMQEYLFPVLHTVLGPGEIAYWSLLGEAFRMMQMRMPLIMPRREFTLLEGTIQKHMSKYELSFADAIHSFEAKKEAWLAAQDDLQLSQRFDEVKTQFEQMYNPLLDSLSDIHQGIRKLGDTNKQKILEQIEFLQARSFDAFQTQHEAALRQLERIHLSIVPLGKPQERVYNVFGYLNKFGIQWIDELIARPMEDPRLHTIVYKK